MAGPSLQDMQDQFNQAQQNSWAQTAAQQQPAHLMMTGRGYPPLPPMAAPSGPAAMSKLSLFAIALCLMLLGIFTFLGGFLLGIWFESPRLSPQVSRVGDVPALGMLPPSQQAYMAPQMAEVPAQGGGAVQNVRQAAQGIGFGGIAASQAGMATQSAVTGVRVPGVPSFLTPLISATQYAVGQQLGYKAQQKVGHGFNGAVSTTPQPSANPQPDMRKEMQMNPLSPQNSPNGMLSEPLSVKTPGESTQETHSPAPLSQGEKGEYTVQLGAYASKENAVSLVNHLHELNYPSFMTEKKSVDGNTLYYVFSGEYKDYKIALDAAYQYVAQNIPGAIVVKMTQKGKGTT